MVIAQIRPPDILFNLDTRIGHWDGRPQAAKSSTFVREPGRDGRVKGQEERSYQRNSAQNLTKTVVATRRAGHVVNQTYR